MLFIKTYKKPMHERLWTVIKEEIGIHIRFEFLYHNFEHFHATRARPTARTAWIAVF